MDIVRSTEGLRIAIVGGGKMGEAIMAGLISSDASVAKSLDARSFIIANPGEERRSFLEARYGVCCVADASNIDGADVVILAVKPQVMMGVLQNIEQLPAYQGGSEGPLFVSIAAGLSTSRLEECLPEGARLVRVMPNMPLQVREGATAVTGGSRASAADVEFVCDLFSCLGYAAEVDESLMDAVCAVSGSGPAYVALMVEALRDAGVKQGLSPVLAESLALQTMYGTAKVLVETSQTPRQLRESVCSPGGTTLAALDALGKAGFAQVVDEGVAAAAYRSKELGSC